MQFITNGPDIPEALLQAHEEGRVVFFCGAGVSYPADLPDFKGLVDEIYRLNHTTPNDIEKDAIDHDKYDATLHLLERRIPAMRKALPEALKPNFRRKGATDTHAALLQLARNREGALRLVTTNFDGIFERASKRIKQSITAYAAPMLPVPKNSRWDGLVYLHGLLPNKPDASALQRLVLTSGDFGLAYLTERWASRFVSELFRNYVVCFIGYSINDPVLRYMMDALAADRRLGEMTPKAYALRNCEPGQERLKNLDGGDEDVIPILYEVPSGSHDHSALHDTLKAWAEVYRDGILGNERIVVEYALARPSTSTKQDDFVGRMLWALSHDSGLPAERFADLNPVAPIEWLEAFTEDRFKHDALVRYGVPPRLDTDDKLRFSLIRRPTPYTHAPWMALVAGGTVDSQWDNVMFHLGRWLLRHLNDPKLILWIVQWGGQLHDRWASRIESELDRFISLERDGKLSELDEIRTNSPNAIPSPLMLSLWRLLLAGRVKSPMRDMNIYGWIDHLKRDGLTTILRLELRELLAPKVVLKKPFHWGADDESSDAPEKLKQLVDFELVLAADYVHSSFDDLTDDHWHESLPILLNEFQQLLLDALDLLRELGEADDHSDRSNWDLPSISEHWQNRHSQDWVSLIVLLRDAWLATRQSDPQRATQIAQGWFDLPYSSFKRLALFAASQEGSITSNEWVEWLLEDNAWWLWSTDTQRETMRLLVLQGANLKPEGKARLEAGILAGPPRKMFREDIEPERWQSLVDHSVWLNLAKLAEGSSRLGDAASHRFADLSAAYPDWKLATNERDEFSSWMSGTGDPDYEASREIDIAPTNRQDLVAWLKKPPRDDRPFYEDNWGDTCRTQFIPSLVALLALTKEGLWPEKRWEEALQVWSADEKTLRRSWRFLAPLMLTMPDDVFKEIRHSATRFLEAVSKSTDLHVSVLLNLCGRVLALPEQDSVGSDNPVSKAINHLIGHVTQALLNLWFKRELNDNDFLPTFIEPFFTQLCDTTTERFRHGRVLLASRLITLFRVDRPWTEVHLLPLFNWNTDHHEAKAAWEGFLWSPRLYGPLQVAFKTQFLDTAHHYADLGEHKRQFARFLTYAALDPADGYTTQDFETAIAALPQDGLQDSAQALSQALEGAGDNREHYWGNRILPFWQKVWPKSSALTTNQISGSLARLSIAAGSEFPSALEVIQDWLKPDPYPHYIIHQLNVSGLVSSFSEDALSLLDAVIDDNSYAHLELRQCLDVISQAASELLQDPRYKRLDIYARQHGY